MAGMEDVTQKLDLIVEVFTDGLGKLGEAGDKVDEFSDKVSDSSEQISGQMDEAEKSLDNTSEAADDTASSFMEATGQGLALLFAGRFLSQVFGGMARSMLDFMGVSDMLSSAMKTVLMPAFIAMMPFFIELTERLMGLDEDTKMLIGAFVMLAAVLAPIIMVFGQIMAMAAAFGIALGTIVSVMGAVVGALGILSAGFYIGVKAVEAIQIAIEGFRKNIQFMVRMVKALMNGEFKQAWGFFKAIVKNTIDSAIDLIASFLPGRLSKAFKKLAHEAVGWAKDVGDSIVDGIRSGVDRVLDMIDNLKNTLTSIDVGSIVPGMGGGNNPSSRSVNDFVMKGDKLMKTHPNDVLFGMKNPDELGGGGGGGDITINIDRPQLNRDMDVDRMVERIKNEIDRDTRGRSGIR